MALSQRIEAVCKLTLRITLLANITFTCSTCSMKERCEAFLFSFIPFSFSSLLTVIGAKNQQKKSTTRKI